MARLLELWIAAVLLTACDQEAMLERFTPKEETEFAKRYLALFQAQDFEAIEKEIDPSLKDSQLRQKLERMAGFFPKEAPKVVRVVGSYTNTTGDTKTANLSFEYEYPRAWVLANVVVQRKGDALLVKGVHVQPATASLATVNQFTFDGKEPKHFALLAGAALVPVFIVFALVAAVRTPIPKRKWLWIIFILLGFVQISLNWTTGDFGVVPLGFQLLGSGFTKMGPYAPVIITTSLPIGAIIFLLRRKHWLNQAQTVHGEG